MSINKNLIFTSLFVALLSGAIAVKSFKDDHPTCDNYIKNTYMYILLGISIVYLVYLIIEKRRYSVTPTKTAIAAIVSILCIFALNMLASTQVAASHLIWLVFIISISVMLYHSLRQSAYKSTLLTVFLITTSLTLLININPELINMSIGPFLVLYLVVLIVVRVFFNITLAPIAALLFMFFIMYDTKLLQQRAMTCTVANYPKESLALFLDVINLYQIIQN